MLPLVKESGVEHTTLVAALVHHGQHYPDREFLKWIDSKSRVTQRLTYKQLLDQSIQVANMLRSKGMQSKDRVMIAYPFGLEFMSGLVGCMMAGVIACSVYPPNPVDRKRAAFSFAQFNNQVRDAGAKYALTTTALKRAITIAGAVAGHRTPGLTWLTTDTIVVPKQGSVLQLEHLPTPEDVAFIQYSSGSTSEPKGIVLTHRAVTYNVTTVVTSSDMSTGRGIGVTWMPQYHDYSLIGFFMGSLYFSSVDVIAISPLDFIRNPLLWADLLEQHTSGYPKVFTAGPNFAFGLLAKRMLAAGRTLKCDKLIRTSIAAEPIAPETLELIQQIGIPKHCLNPYVHASHTWLKYRVSPNADRSYGLAEVCAYAVDVIGDDIRVIDGIVSCGSLAKTEQVGKIIRIADEASGEIVPNGDVGQMFVRGPDLASGYWMKPELQSKFECRLSDGQEYFATGDLGKIVDGRLYVMGRIKELIIINGKNVYPTDLERLIESEYPKSVRPGSTVCFQANESSVGVALEMRPGSESSNMLDSQAVATLLSNAYGLSLESCTILKKGAVPKTTSGKLKRVECRRLSLEGSWAKKSVLADWSSASGFLRRDSGNSSMADDSKAVHADDPMTLMNQILGSHLEQDRTWEDNGLTSLNRAELVSAVAEQLRVNLAVDFDVQYPTPALLNDFIVSSKGEKFPCRNATFSTASRRQHERWLGALQVCGVLAILCLFVLSLVPSFVVAKSLRDLSVTFEIGTTGRYATWFWIPATLPVFAITLSVLVIIVKWIVVGRYTSRAYELPSLGYIRWWFVDHVVQLWELWVGQFLLDTLLLVVFYKFLGANISWSAKLNSFVREFDLVSIGDGSSIDHQIRCRKFRHGDSPQDAQRLCFRSILIGKCCEISGMVSPGATVNDGAKVEALAALDEGAVVPPNVVAKGSPAFLAKVAERTLSNGMTRKESAIFEMVKVLWLVVELYIFYGCFLASQVVLNQRLPVKWRYSPMVYWLLLLACIQVFALVCSVALKWLLIGKRNSSHEKTLYRRFACWSCDLHFHLAVYLLWATPLHNSRLWNIVLMFHGLDVDLQSFFVDILAFVPSKVDFFHIRNSFFSAAVAIDVHSPLEVLECNVGYGVRFEGEATQPTIVRGCIIPPRSVIDSSLDGESFGSSYPKRTGSAAMAICKELCHLLLLCLFPATLIPAFEFFMATSGSNMQYGHGATFGSLLGATLIQYAVWILTVYVVQSMFVRKGVHGELYTCHIAFIWALRTFSCAWLLQGTPFFGYLARLLGSQVDGELWCFGCSFYDFNMLHFADKTIVDYDCHITGHYTIFDELVIDNTLIGGLVHPGCYAHGGAKMVSTKDNRLQQHGPWKHYLQQSSSCKAQPRESALNSKSQDTDSQTKEKPCPSERKPKLSLEEWV